MAPVRVLIVDDNQVLRLILAKWLAAIPGLSVIGEAVSGREALVALEKTRPELVVTDVEMPGMSGFDLTRRIRQMANAPRVVIMSASNPPEYRELAEDAGAEAFIYKGSLHAELSVYLGMEFGIEPLAASQS